jgi:hypothetical protein
LHLTFEERNPQQVQPSVERTGQAYLKESPYGWKRGNGENECG